MQFKALQLLIKLKFGNAKEAICVTPKLSRVFIKDFPQFIQSNLDYQLDKYCRSSLFNADDITQKLFTSINIGNVSCL